MGLFNRKKKQEDIKIPQIPHEHTFKDFPWYMETEYNGSDKTASYRIVEPYVCIYCGERKNIILDKAYLEHISPSGREEMYKSVRETYKDNLKPRAVVEDMISDIQLVKDAEHLKLVEKICGLPHRDVGNAACMKKEPSMAPKIEMK